MRAQATLAAQMSLAKRLINVNGWRSEILTIIAEQGAFRNIRLDF